MSSRQRTSNHKICLPDERCEGRTASEGKQVRSEESESQPRVEEFAGAEVDRKRTVRKMTEADCADPLYITHV